MDATGASTPDFAWSSGWLRDVACEEVLSEIEGRDMPDEKIALAKVLPTTLRKLLDPYDQKRSGEAERRSPPDQGNPRPGEAADAVALPPPKGSRVFCPYATFRVHRGPSSGKREPIVSLGSVGHPETCAAACALRSACVLGAACKLCHLCGEEPGPQAEASDSCPSVGSTGHPSSCSAPCKYHFKRQGCKDGSLCDHCHLCRWRRPAPAAGKRFCGAPAGSTK